MRKYLEVRELQVPLPTLIPRVFGSVRIVFVSPSYLSNWDAHYSVEITKTAGKGGIWRRGPDFVLAVGQEPRNEAASEPE